MDRVSAGRIFISYRRDDTQHVAGRLADWIGQRFGEGHVFMDVDSIEPGVDFAQAIDEAVGGCDALIALIGPEWLTLANESGDRRLDDPDDFVVLEVTAALTRRIRVIPVLVDGASMPRPSELPAALAQLARRNAARLDHETFRLHATQLLETLEKIVSHGSTVPTDDAPSRPDAGNVDQPELEPGPESGSSSPEDVGGADAAVGVLDDPDYTRGLAAYFTERWPDAIAAFERVLDRYPDDHHVVHRISRARSRQQLLTSDHDAEEAARGQRWHEVVTALERIVAVEPGYNDASSRLAAARRQARIADLQDDVRRLRAARSWAAVVAAGEMLAALDPYAADPDGIVSAARGELAEAERAATYALALRQMDRSEWAAAIETLRSLQDDQPGYRDSEALLVHAESRLTPASTGPASVGPTSEQPLTPSSAGGPVVADDSGRWASLRAGALALGLPDRTLTGHGNWVLTVAFSPDGRLLASASADTTVRLWDHRTGDSTRTLTGHTDWVRSVAFAPDGRTLASASDDKTVRLWDATTGEERHRLTAAGWMRSVAYSPDGRTLAASSDETVGLWDPATGDEMRMLSGHTGRVFSVAFSPDGRTLASAGDDKTVRLWDPKTGEVMRMLSGHTGLVRSVVFSPDGRSVATGSDDNTVRLWDPATAQLVRTLTGHGNIVYAVAYAPDGDIVVSGGGGAVFRGDNIMRIWASGGDHLQDLPRWGKPIRGIAFAPDGRSLAVGNENRHIGIWDLP